MTRPQGNQVKKSVIFYTPLLIVLMLGTVFSFRLYSGDPSIVPSALIAKPVPDFNLGGIPDLQLNGRQVNGFSGKDLKKGHVSIVNMFASWCDDCRLEHQALLDLSKDKRIKVYGIDYKDNPKKALEYLNTFGNPYESVGVDAKGSTSIDWGLYGVPETFIISSDGHILYKKIGAINAESYRTEIMPEIEKALKLKN